MRMARLRPGCSTEGHCRPPYRSIVKIGGFAFLLLFPSFFNFFKNHADTISHYCRQLPSLHDEVVFASSGDRLDPLLGTWS